MAAPGVVTFGHRRVLENLWGQGYRIGEIARLSGLSRFTVSREFARNCSARHGTKNPLGQTLPPKARGPYRWGYTAVWAQRRAEGRLPRPKPARLAAGTRLHELVLALLRRRWSPAQIAGWLKETFPDRPELHVCHETIYQAIYVQARGGLRAELKRIVGAGAEPLRSGRAGRRAQSRQARSGRAWVSDAVRISARPAEAADRAVPGHWEGDLLIGKAGRSGIVTLVERATRFVMLGQLPHGRDAGAVAAVLSQLAGRLPQQLRRSLTWDQGVELAEHAAFTVATGCPVYFCDPHSPWQRGSNENTNGLLRQYFPKHSFDFTTITQADLDAVARELNTRPRQTLGWKTPSCRLNQLLAA